MVLPIFVIGVVVAAMLVSFPWETLTVLSLCYLASLPLSWRAFHRRERADGDGPESMESTL